MGIFRVMSAISAYVLLFSLSSFALDKSAEDISLNSKMIGNLISKMYSNDKENSPDSGANLDTEEIDELRKSYLAIFEEHSKRAADDPDFFKRELTNAALHMIGNKKVSEARTITVAVDGQVYVFENNSIISIGRQPPCDILITKEDISRLHGLLIITDTEYMIVDMGALSGIQTLSRSSANAPASSKSKDRKILVFDFDETSVLVFSTTQISINPKECLLCLDRARELRFSCGHAVMCGPCYQKSACTICQLCRKPIRTISFGMASYTFMLPPLNKRKADDKEDPNPAKRRDSKNFEPDD